jgi:predicted transcriptional regulator
MRYNAPPLIESSMLLIASAPLEDKTVLEVGSTCGVCPKSGCPGRREPSILMDGL